MNNAKIWLVVKPTVGLPLFLGAVAATSLFVHYNLLKTTTWLPAYYQGKPKKAAALDVPAQPGVGQAAVVMFKDGDASQEAVVLLPDGRTAKAVFDGRTTVASTALDVVK
nr:light-harvesting protein [uncultured Alsobacter sp.]